MATFYSSLFSSGLLAHQLPTSSAQTPEEGPSPATTPRAHHASLAPEDMQSENDTTPTANLSTKTSTFGSSSTSSSDLLPSITIGASAPPQQRLRRRRSSLTVATSPVAALKSTPMRSAATSIQRQSLLSVRARSGSNASMLSTSSAGSDHGSRQASEAGRIASTFVGRLRSGSLGTSLRFRHNLGRKKLPPALPPPLAPLPALPPISIPSPTKSPPATPPRRPIANRSLTADNYQTAMSSVLYDSDPDFAGYPIPSSPGYAPALDESCMINMSVDYPSPLSTSKSLHRGGD